MKFRKAAARAALFAQDVTRNAIRSTRQRKPARPVTRQRDTLKLSTLFVTQEPDSPLLDIQMQVLGEHAPDALWVESNNKLERLNDFRSSVNESSEADTVTTFSCTVDTDSLVAQLPGTTSVSDETDLHQENADGYVLRFYLGYETLSDASMQLSDFEIDRDGNTVGMVRLGRALVTKISDTNYRHVDYHFY